MKSQKYFFSTISLAISGLCAFSAANAATSPATIAAFTTASPTKTLMAKSTAWRDPAFGDMGWTHSSAWGRFVATKGQKVVINISTSVAGLHPGITVWSRGKEDTAPNKYVPDHFYPQNSSQSQYGAIDEVTGKKVGDIWMSLAAYGYDADGHAKPSDFPHGKKDSVPGRLILSFIAPKTAAYMFVVGGFNPNRGIDGSIKYEFKTTVKVSDPL